MTSYDRAALDTIALETIDGQPTTLADYPAQVLLIVNVASRCGHTPQYEALERMHRQYRDRGFAVLGFPSNQFLQELGSEQAVKEFCSLTYDVTFPMFSRTRLNGKKAHPLYQQLVKAKDAAGEAGKVQWNFEKFLLTPDGAVHRFRSTVQPDDPAIVSLIEQHLPE